MLVKFLDWWEHNYPDIITGWNVQLYDIPYICGRMNRVLEIEKVHEEVFSWDYFQKQQEVYIMGKKEYRI